MQYNRHEKVTHVGWMTLQWRYWDSYLCKNSSQDCTMPVLKVGWYLVLGTMAYYKQSKKTVGS